MLVEAEVVLKAEPLEQVVQVAVAMVNQVQEQRQPQEQLIEVVAVAVLDITHRVVKVAQA
jgi:hypothetical protein